MIVGERLGASPGLPVVLGAKVRPPALAGLWLRRFDPIAVRVAETGLLVVSAPAGSGKTTFLAMLARRRGTAACWYRAEATDYSEQALAVHLQQVLAGAVTTSVARTWSSIDDVIAALDRLDGPALLVVDDADTLAGTPAGRALGRLAHCRPAALTLAIGGRAGAPFALDRLRLAGHLVEVGHADLRFRPWEVETLFQQHYHQALRPEDAARLAGTMGGWAAGLQLFHLATTDKPPAARRRLLAELPGRSTLVRDYLTRNVLAELPAELRDFLVGTTPLGVLQGDLCDRFLGVAGSASHLRELARRGVFTTSDDGGVTYRYHDVLRSWLDAELLATAGVDGAAAAHRRAGALLEEAGLAEDALRAYCRAGAWTDVERVVGDGPAEQPAGAVDWLALLPPSISDHDPWILSSRARLLLRQGHLTGALALFQRAEQEGAKVRPDAAVLTEGRGLQAWTASDRASSDDWPAHLRDATVTAPAAALGRLAANDEPAWCVAASIALLLSADLHGARAHAHLAKHHPDASSEARAVATLVDALARSLAGDPDGPFAVGLAVANVAEAGITAAGSLLRLLEEPGVVRVPAAPGSHDAWASAAGSLAAGWVRLTTGDTVAAGALLTAASNGLRDLGAPVLEAWADAGLAAAQGTPVGVASLRRRLGDQADALAALGRRWATSAPTTSADAEASVALRCLGPFELAVGGAPVELNALRPRARQVLRYLAAHAPSPVHREVIIEALWPEAAPEAGRHRLQVAVSSVRHHLNGTLAGLGDRLLRRTGEAYVLAVEGVEIDVAQASAELVAARHLEREGASAAAVDGYGHVLERFRGPPLVEDGSADWAVAVRARLIALAAEAARRVTRLHLVDGHGDRAAEACATVLALDPYDDALWRLRIEALELHGNHLAAARARASHAGLLADTAGDLELGASAGT